MKSHLHGFRNGAAWLKGCVAALLLGASAFGQAAVVEEVHDLVGNPGNLHMYRYVPDNLRPNAPLLVALHGCTQTAAEYATASGLTEYADKWGFALLLPQQNLANNYAGCFNWFFTFNATRGQGEVASVKSMVDRMVAEHGLDARRVYATGLSAGAATTSNLLAAYPDVFAGGAIIAGLPYGCADSVDAGIWCMFVGVDLPPALWADKLRAASSHGGPWPRVQIWHGELDPYVVIANQRELMEQWTAVHGLGQTPDSVESLAGHTRSTWLGADGRPVVETIRLQNFGHGVPVAPGDAAYQCGSEGSYFLNASVCASYEIVRGFGLHRASDF